MQLGYWGTEMRGEIAALTNSLESPGAKWFRLLGTGRLKITSWCVTIGIGTLEED